MKILVVEDDRQLASIAYEALSAKGYEVDLASSGEIGVEKASTTLYDAILLDINLPVLSGFEVCRQLRANGITSSIIMLTSRDDTEDVITGLKAGADDYMTKPYSTEILLARIESAARRQGSYRSDNRLRYDNLMVDPDTRRAWRDTEELELSKREFELLHFLIANKDTALSRDKILNHVWGEYNENTNNIIDVYIGYLRKKVDFEPHAPLLHTLRGYGYVLRKIDEKDT